MRSSRFLPWAVFVVMVGWSMGRAFSGQDAPEVPFYTDKANLLVVLAADGTSSPVKTWDDWKLRRDHVLANLQRVTGPLPESNRRVPLDVRISESVAKEGYVQHKLTYTSEKFGEEPDRVSGYLLIPADAQGKKLPAVLCLHQTVKIGKDEPAGLGGSENLHYASELAQRGYVTLTVDYPNFGEYTIDPYAHGYLSATMKGIWNHIRAVDLLQEREEVDPQRIGVIGHSLGGHNAIFVAVFDPRIKCIVSCCGFCSFPSYKKGDLSGWSHAGYMPRIKEQFESDPAKVPFDFTELIGCLAPRPFLAVAPVKDENFEVEGVRDCITAASPIYTLSDAREKLAAEYPDASHDFPPSSREVAYAWFDRWLKPTAP
jgi:dienelactone hydrolase